MGNKWRCLSLLPPPLEFIAIAQRLAVEPPGRHYVHQCLLLYNNFECKIRQRYPLAEGQVGSNRLLGEVTF